MPTKAELKRLANLPKCKFRKGDNVLIIAGKDKGQRGFIEAVDPVKNRAYVLQENPDNPDQPLPLNAATKHRKKKYENEKSARVRIPLPIQLSNLMVIDPASGEPSRVGRRVEKDKIVRYAKRSGKTIEDKPNIERKK